MNQEKYNALQMPESQIVQSYSQNLYSQSLQDFNPQIVAKAIQLLHPDGELFEIRLINGNYNASGYFNSADTAIQALQSFKAGWKKEELAKGANIFITMNPVSMDCYARKQHDKMLESVKPTTKDDEITTLNWFLIDLDPVRKTGVSSSESELEKARQKAREIYQFLEERGWKSPVVAMSGNGMHLVYRFHVENNAENAMLWQESLHVLVRKFTDSEVDIDKSVFNPARICKLWGTIAQKGYGTPERPHRMAEILDCTPEKPEINDISFLKSLVEDFPAPVEEKTKSSVTASQKNSKKALSQEKSDFDLDAFIQKYNIPVKSTESTADGTKYILEHCLFDESHTGKDAAIFRKTDGTLGYKCFHAHCADKHWKDVRLLFEPDAYDKRITQTPVKKAEKESAPPSPYDKDGSGKLTFDNFQAFCSCKGFSVRLNEITHQMEFSGFGSHYSDNTFGSAVTIAYSELIKDSGLTKISVQIIEYYLIMIGKRNSYNPVLEIIEREIYSHEVQGLNAWDGVDRIQQIYDIFQIPEKDISRIFIKKWLMQCIAGLYNTPENPFSLDIVLVFQGKQGVGKTRFFERLARLLSSNFFREGACIDPRNKDSIMQVTASWICELGEIGSTMRKDIDAVKAFLTSAIDTYRVPYGKNYETYPRLTSFVGTVNDEQFLVDKTGNRRFATITLSPSLRISADKIQNFDSLQLWIQVYEMVHDAIRNGETYASCFRLNDEEKSVLELRNSHLIKLSDTDVAVRDVIYQQSLPEQGYYITEDWLTASQFIENNNALRYCKTQQVGRALKSIEIESKRTKLGVLYKVPVKHYISNGQNPNNYSY